MVKNEYTDISIEDFYAKKLLRSEIPSSDAMNHHTILDQELLECLSSKQRGHEEPGILTNHTNPLTGKPYLENDWAQTEAAHARYREKFEPKSLSEEDQQDQQNNIYYLNEYLGSMQVRDNKMRKATLFGEIDMIKTIAKEMNDSRVPASAINNSSALDEAIKHYKPTEKTEAPYFSGPKADPAGIENCYDELIANGEPKSNYMLGLNIRPRSNIQTRDYDPFKPMSHQMQEDARKLLSKETGGSPKVDGNEKFQIDFLIDKDPE